MSGVFDVLGHDHDEVKKIFGKLEEGRAAVDATEDQLAERREIVETLIIAESKHEAVEEQFFWPYVRSHVDGGDELADTATHQESEGKYVLDALRKKSADDADFEDLLGRFIADGREHIRFEEEQVWPRLRSILSPEEEESLGNQLAAGKSKAPTRPHPATPPKPGVLKTAGAAAAMADRARDAVTGRGKE